MDRQRTLEIKITHRRDGIQRIVRFAPGTPYGQICKQLGVEAGAAFFYWTDQGRYLQPSECRPECPLESGAYECDLDDGDEEKRWPTARVVALQEQQQQQQYREPIPAFERRTGNGNGVLIVVVGVVIVLLLVVTLLLLVS